MPPDWRTAANTSIIKDTYFTNVVVRREEADRPARQVVAVNIIGVHFKNLTVQGNAVTTQTDADASWNINSFVSGITFE